MVELFRFSNGQDLTGLDSTGVVSENYWDLEYDDNSNLVVTDGQVCGWFNFTFGASNAGATEGLYIEVRSSDNTNIAASYDSLGLLFLTDAELTAASGKTYAIGVSKANLQRYLGVWYRAHTTSLAGTATPIYAWFSTGPENLSVTQKKPV